MAVLLFVWDDWNRLHVTKHGSNQTDAQYVVENAGKSYPRDIAGDKLVVHGQTKAGMYLEVIFALKISDQVAFDALTFLDWGLWIGYPGTVAPYVCHAMPMTEDQIRRHRKLRRT